MCTYPACEAFGLTKRFCGLPSACPKGTPQHATPRLGGAAILLSFLINISAFAGLFVPQFRDMIFGANPFVGVILLGSVGVFIIGFLDDLARLAPKTKLIGEF